MIPAWTSLQRVADELALGEHVSDLERQAGRDRCSVAFLGEFSRGKSSLINSLLGRALLPTDVRPCSAGVVTLEHGEEVGVLHAADDTPVSVSPDALRAVQTPESGGSSDPDRAAWVEFTLPFPAPLRDVRLIDSPGVNDLGETAPEIVYRLLPSVDLVVYVLEAPAGLTNTEAAFIRGNTLRLPDVPAVAFFNKLDRAEIEDAEEREELFEELTEEVRPALPVGSAVLFGSCHDDLGHLVAELVRRCDQAVSRRKDRLRRVAFEELRAHLERELAALGEHDSDGQVALERMSSARSSLESAMELFRDHLRGQGMPVLRSMLARSLESWRRQTRRDLGAQIDIASDPARFAEHGLGLAVERAGVTWCERHIPPVREFLRRHGRMALDEARRTFGGLGFRFDPETVFLWARSGDSAALPAAPAAPSNEVLTRYGVAAAGSLAAGLVAAPLSVIGFAAGLALYEHRRQASQQRLREDLHADLQTLLDEASRRLEGTILDVAEDRFQRLDRALHTSFLRQLAEADDALSRAREEEAGSVDARDSRRSRLLKLREQLHGGA